MFTSSMMEQAVSNSVTPAPMNFFNSTATATSPSSNHTVMWNVEMQDIDIEKNNILGTGNFGTV